MTREERRAVADAFVAACGAYRIGRVGRCRIAICATELDGLHTGRRRYMVGCDSCGVLIHSATTGPAWNIERHVAEVEERR